MGCLAIVQGMYTVGTVVAVTVPVSHYWTHGTCAFNSFYWHGSLGL